MAWNVESHVGRRPWSRYRLYHFQLGFCRWCGLGKQRWIGEAAIPAMIGKKESEPRQPAGLCEFPGPLWGEKRLGRDPY
jgi:hypothetical protein